MVVVVMVVVNWRDDRGDKVPERDPARVAYLDFRPMVLDRDPLAGAILRLEGRPETGALVHGFDQGLQDQAMKTAIVVVVAAAVAAAAVGTAAAAAAGAGAWYSV